MNGGQINLCCRLMAFGVPALPGYQPTLNVATEEMSSAATEEMSCVASEEMSSVATEEMSPVATEEIFSVATEATYHKNTQPANCARLPPPGVSCRGLGK